MNEDFDHINQNFGHLNYHYNRLNQKILICLFFTRIPINATKIF